MKLVAPMLLFLIALTLAVSCKKEDSSTPVTPVDTTHHITGGPAISEHVTSKNWRVVAATLDPGVLGQTNAFVFIDTCVTDDIYMFHSDSTFVQDEGATKCKPGDPQARVQGTWTVNSAGTLLRVVPSSGSTGTIDYTILDVTATTMKLRFPYVVLGNTQQLTETFRVL